jgi:hypothetical protein
MFQTGNPSIAKACASSAQSDNDPGHRPVDINAIVRPITTFPLASSEATFVLKHDPAVPVEVALTLPYRGNKALKALRRLTISNSIEDAGRRDGGIGRPRGKLGNAHIPPAIQGHRERI